MFPQITIGPEVLQAIQVVLAVVVAYLLAFSVSLLIWTYQDMRSRSRSGFAIFFAVLLVLGFNLPGLLLYLLLRPSETLALQYERALEEEAILQDLEKRAACPNCKRGVRADFLICPYCRTQLRRPCHRCGQPLQALWRACPYCAAPVALEPVETGPAALEAAPGPSSSPAQQASL